ncbi:MAG TPA: PepSY domain-containing protein [Metabacillus sp.]|nr:PepSY domain-containing protein [Metabacillus sp.]
MKKLITVSLATVVVLGGAVAVNHSYAQEKTENIGIEKAKEAALKKVDGVVEDIELENHNGQPVYEVEIDKGQKDYDLYIDGTTAKVNKVKEKDDDDDINAESISNSSFITEEEAIELAKTKINGELIEIDFDEDDGRYVYDMEFRTATGEAEITIDAKTKDVLEFENDDHDD